MHKKCQIKLVCFKVSICYGIVVESHLKTIQCHQTDLCIISIHGNKFMNMTLMVI